jgi:MerR HTH family regulatory protein
MSFHLTSGEFQTMTGLSAKALRLYAERGIVTPAAVDPHSAYRLYGRDQLQHGTVVDLLRRARVPLTELASASAFPFDDWRETVAMNRIVEDFYLDVAEKVAAFDADQFIALSAPAPAVNWVGVVIDLGIPEDIDEKVAAFTGWAGDMPAIEQALNAGLDHLEIATSPMSWTAVPESAPNGSQQMQLTRSVIDLPDSSTLDLLDQRIRAATTRKVTIVTGTLPRRREVTFTATNASSPTPVDEAADGYLQLLAFEHHIAHHGLTAIGRTARQVRREGSMLPPVDDPSTAPVSVFDVQVPDGD